MAKVSIGLRGWRFEESEIFTDAGEFRPLDEIPDDPRERLLRLVSLVEEPCDGCYLIYGETDRQRCRRATVVYGEPGEEVVLCDEHETDFVYWYREAEGASLRGREEFRDAFHEWFLDGGRAPDGYRGLDHVETDPDELPDPPSAEEIQRRLNQQLAESGDRLRIDVLEEAGVSREDDADDEEETASLSIDDVDLDTDYPTK